MERIKRAAKVTFRNLDDFFLEAKKRDIKQVFRNWGEREENHMAIYSGWDEGEVFLVGYINFPELRKMSQSLPDRRYRSTGWDVNENGIIEIRCDSKTNLIKALQALGVTDELKELRKLTIENIRGIVDESTEEEDRSTNYRRGGVFTKTLACNAIDGLVKELTVKITVDERRDASYLIHLGDWVQVIRQLEQRHEECFRHADIRVIPGEVELV